MRTLSKDEKHTKVFDKWDSFNWPTNARLSNVYIYADRNGNISSMEIKLHGLQYDNLCSWTVDREEGESVPDMAVRLFEQVMEEVHRIAARIDPFIW